MIPVQERDPQLAVTGVDANEDTLRVVQRLLSADDELLELVAIVKECRALNTRRDPADVTFVRAVALFALNSLYLRGRWT